MRGASRTVGIIGWPVAHSLSPAIHNAAFAALGLDWVYVPLPVAPAALPAALAGLAALGFAGANVTMPHKTVAAERSDELSEDARRLQAVNTLVVEDGPLHGHNTDAPGFDRFLRRDAGFDPAGRSALLFGAGGAARAVALALARGGLAELTVAVRDPVASPPEPRAEALGGSRDRADGRRFDGAAAMRPRPRRERHPGGGGRRGVPAPALGPGQLVVDLLYQPAQTPLHDVRARGGRGGLRGARPAPASGGALLRAVDGGVPPLDVMSAAALAELAARHPVGHSRFSGWAIRRCCPLEMDDYSALAQRIS